MRELLRMKLTEALTSTVPELTKRDVRLPEVPGKAFSVIGMRRSGKTTYLWQCLQARLDAGVPREALIMLELEDERLQGIQAADLGWLMEEYFRRYPTRRGDSAVTLFLDEIQTVPGWEAFARRMIDSEKISLFLSGSSAHMLSKEVASSMRGRALPVAIQPFSFREVLRHNAVEPTTSWNGLPVAIRSDLDHRLGQFLIKGGFPESQGLDERDRFALLRSYIDVVILRDVIERHAVSNPLPLRWMQRQLLANPAGLFSVQKYYAALKSQGLPVGKDTLHSFLGYLEDSFLIHTVSLHSASERKRMVHPRKAYPADPGLIPLYEKTGRPNLGHALETVIFLELIRRGYEVDYVQTSAGYEVDFMAVQPGRPRLLIQVSVDVHDPQTYAREVRALVAAAKEFRNVQFLLITLESTPPSPGLPDQIAWHCAAEWLLHGLDE